MVMEMSKTYQYRKVMKPLLERKRRARINKCLDDLKDLMVECLQQEGEHVTRLEKADILELTVEHMRKLKQRGGLSLQSPTSAAHVESFRSGYVHAADQISQVLLQQRQTDEIGAKIMKFLSSRLLEMSPQLYRATLASTALTSLPEPSAKHNYMTPALPTTAKMSLTTPLSFYASTTSNTTTTTTIGTTLHDREKMHNCDLLIDVTTVDNCSSSADNVSVISVDSASSSESVWRPW